MEHALLLAVFWYVQAGHAHICAPGKGLAIFFGVELASVARSSHATPLLFSFLFFFDLSPWIGRRGRASSAHFISVSQKHSGAWLQAVPAAPDLRMASDAFEIAVQRRLRAPIAALAGATRSRVLNRDVDKYGDAHQNVPRAHGARHNKPLQKFLQCFRAVFGHAVRMEDRYHSGYSPTVRPDLTHLKGAPDGTPPLPLRAQRYLAARA